MVMDTRRESARIYPFPTGRAVVKREVKPAIAVTPIPAGRCWYHDVAIRDSKSEESKPRG